jgi:hypothetical protein
VSSLQYQALITSEHAGKAKFMAVVDALCAPLADAQALLASLPSLFDLDTAVGEQLDFTGAWVGRSRELNNPLLGIYFSFGDPDRGLGAGEWYNPSNPYYGVVVLDDERYRALLRAWVLIKHWDGSNDQLSAAWEALLDDPNVRVLVQDLGDMTITLFVLSSAPINPFSLAMFGANVLEAKPDGVRINGFYQEPTSGTPFFGFGYDTDLIAGLGHGGWAQRVL